MEKCFVLFTTNREFEDGVKKALDGTAITVARASGDLKGLFKRNHLNILLIDDAMPDTVYMFALKEASFFPARVNSFLIGLNDGKIMFDGEAIVSPKDYFIEKVV